MTGSIRRAAIVLNSLPRPEAARLMSRLEPAQAAAVAVELDRLGVPDGREQVSAWREFAARNPKSAANRLLAVFGGEHPRTLAVVLSCLPVDLAAGVLAGLSEETQRAVLHRIAGLQPIAGEILDRLEQSLPAGINGWRHNASHPIGGPGRARQISQQCADPATFTRLAREIV